MAPAWPQHGPRVAPLGPQLPRTLPMFDRVGWNLRTPWFLTQLTINMDGYNYTDDYDPTMGQYYEFGNTYDDLDPSLTPLLQHHSQFLGSHQLQSNSHSSNPSLTHTQGQSITHPQYQPHSQQNSTTNSTTNTATNTNHSQHLHNSQPPFQGSYNQFLEYPYRPMFLADGDGFPKNFDYNQQYLNYQQPSFPHQNQSQHQPDQSYNHNPNDYYYQNGYFATNSNINTDNDDSNNESSTSANNNADSALKRKISIQTGKKFKKDPVRPPIKPIRQNSNPNIPKRKPRPQMNKSYSYSIDSNKDVGKKPENSTGKPGNKEIPKSLFDFKRKPNFYLNLDNLKNSSVQSLEQQPLDSPASASLAGNSHLKILDHDLHFDNDFNNDLTPNMKPPGTNTNDYFEDYLIPTSFDNNNGNINLANNIGATTSDNNDDLTGFNFNLYEKDYGEYDSDDVTGHKTNVKINVDDEFNWNRNNSDQNASDYEFGENNLGFGDHGGQGENLIYKDDGLLDAGMAKFSPLTYNKEGDTQYDDSQDDHRHRDYNFKDEQNTGNSELNHDKKSPLTPISNSPNSQANLSTGSNNGISPHLYKTNSNQSISSTNSAGSTKEKSKKKTPKGALCPICGKYISRDLSRHLRIHDDIGRFRCVYPTICSHKTGKFNRPYDYKKHLLHVHFAFDDPQGKTANNLTDKLPIMGNCKACDYKSTAKEWLEHHVLTNDETRRCKFVERAPVPPESKAKKTSKPRRLELFDDSDEE